MRIVKLGTQWWAVHVARMEEARIVFLNFSGTNLLESDHLEDLRRS
jgi:hypothetical protein